MKGIVVPLADLIALKGEENVLDILSHFSCNGKNNEVEEYLKETAIRHTRKNTSITHLVMTPDCSECLAYADSGKLGQLFFFLDEPQAVAGDIGS